jgi:flagellar biosynthesis component FlhA
LLAPIEKPNIPSSIDTLDEQKTDKKPKDKKKKKKKKKDEERDNPSDVQDNNVLTYISSYKHITLKKKYNSSEIAHECY